VAARAAGSAENQEPSRTVSRSRIGTLDGIRGIAILLVILGHLAQNSPLEPETRRWCMAFANSSAGVRLFFVLSGYLITQLLLEEQTATGRIALGKFYARRALRIFPAFYAYLAGLAILSLWMPTGLTWGGFFSAAGFVWNYHFLWLNVSPEGTWNLGHLWTLALEQQFYLLWPAALIWGGPRWAGRVTVLLLLWCPIARIGSYFLFPDLRGHLASMLHTSLDSMMAGCGAALLISRPAVRDWLGRQGLALTAAGGIWLFLLSPVLAEMRHGYPLALGITLDALVAAALIAQAHLAPPPSLLPLLGQGLLPKLGLVSYSLYLWQQPFLSASGAVGGGRILWPVLGALGVAMLSYFLVEKPALRFKPRTNPTLSRNLKPA
jgi:peptidoglycan/LPS O-acetylase OafA/YrhL